MGLLVSISESIERGLKAFRRNRRTGERTGTISDVAMREEISIRKKIGNPTHVLTCEDCRHWHEVYAESDKSLRAAIDEWKGKHFNHNRRVSSVPLWDRSGWKHNSDVKEQFQVEQSLNVAALQSLASSPTAGWGSDSVDNTSNLYLNSLVMCHIEAVNTAPASDKAIYLFAYGSTDGAIFTGTGTSGGAVGTQGALTFPNISTLPILMPTLGIIPYPVQNKPLDGGPFGVARCFDNILPVKWGVALLNFTGFTFTASGNTIKYRGQYNTVI